MQSHNRLGRIILFSNRFAHASRSLHMPTITFVNEKRELQVAEGANLRKEALAAGINLYPGLNGYGAAVNKVLNCHGLGMCGTCRVNVTKGMENTNDPTFMEKAVFKFHPFDSMVFIGNEKTMRLACCMEVNGDVTVQTCPDVNLAGENFFS